MDLNPQEHAPAVDGDIAPPADFYYASLYLTPPARYAARVLEAVRRAITDIPAACTDTGVAHLKLAWWQSELQQIETGMPRHPLVQALMPLAISEPHLIGVFERMVATTVAGLHAAPLMSRAAVLQWVNTQHRELLEHYLCFGVAAHPPQRGALLEIGALLELAYALRGLRQHRRGGPLLLAGDRLSAAGLSVDAVRGAQRSSEIEPVLAGEIDWLRDELLSRCVALPRSLRRAQRLITTLAVCTVEALALTRADGCQVLEHRVELLPLRKLWLAWRVRRFG